MGAPLLGIGGERVIQPKYRRFPLRTSEGIYRVVTE
jgi:hypothetical protein